MDISISFFVFPGVFNSDEKSLFYKKKLLWFHSRIKLYKMSCTPPPIFLLLDTFFIKFTCVYLYTILKQDTLN